MCVLTQTGPAPGRHLEYSIVHTASVMCNPGAALKKHEEGAPDQPPVWKNAAANNATTQTATVISHPARRCA